jgi:hypothetical protein
MLHARFRAPVIALDADKPAARAAGTFMKDPVKASATDFLFSWLALTFDLQEKRQTPSRRRNDLERFLRVPSPPRGDNPTHQKLTELDEVIPL